LQKPRIFMQQFDAACTALTFAPTAVSCYKIHLTNKMSDATHGAAELSQNPDYKDKT
jgi:hypothetical protein